MNKLKHSGQNKMNNISAESIIIKEKTKVIKKTYTELNNLVVA